MRRIAATLFVAVVLLSAGLLVRASLRHPKTGPPCQATGGATRGATVVRLDIEQAASATTIAAVGKRTGLSNHAVTIALAAALQESGLHNLPGGDLDSVGLFQQRPSQGWGTKTQILSPRYAAAAFYQRLAQVADWQTLPVTQAAQAVQRSAAPNAYSQWERQARVLARALTGEVAAAFSCQLGSASGGLATTQLSSAMAVELGVPSLQTTLPSSRGWTVATWLVGHARQYRIGSVRFEGHRWSSGSGLWAPDPTAGTRVEISG